MYYTPSPPPSPEPQNVNAIKMSSSSINTAFPQPLQVLLTPERPDISTSQTNITTSPEPRLPVNQDPDYLVEEMMRITNDTHSNAAFRQVACRVPEQTIFQALSATRLAMAESSIYKPGAYFIGVIRSLCPEFLFKKTMKVIPPSLSVENRLSKLQSKYPSLRVESLFNRYIEVKRDTTGLDEPADSSYWLPSYEKFLAIHHTEIYAEKPQYRREVDA